MKRFTKTLLASAAVLAIAAVPVLAAGPGAGTTPSNKATTSWNCPNGGPGGGMGMGYGYQTSAKTLAALKLTDAQKAAYDEYQKVANDERQARWDTHAGMSSEALAAMTPEQFRDFQTQMMQTRMVGMTKVSEARQKFIDTLTDEQKQKLGNSFGPGGRGGPGGGWGGRGGWMMQ